MRDEKRIAAISKEWFTWGDCYAVDFDDPADEYMALAVTLVIDCCMAQQNQ